MLRILMLSIILFGTGNVQSQEMRIGIFHHLNMRGIFISADEGSYDVFGDTTSLGSLETLNIQWKNKGVGVTTNGIVNVFDTLLIVKRKEVGSIKLKGTSPSTKQHYYEDNFEITRGPKGLRIVNRVSMNNYLCGVIESEGGGGRDLEYYKVQALMSRTYALKNRNRYTKKYGYQLSDGVDCQAYHNKLRFTPSIRKAVEETEGMVLVDQYNKLVTTYFSANSGGQTCDAAYVWNNSVPYLEPFIDTFSMNTRQATWTKKIDKYAWRNYLRDQFGVTEQEYGDLIYNFQSEDRTAFYIHPSLGVPMRDLRSKFRLKSAYFETRLEGNKVILDGRGFGHGVGLSQEGAMEMARQGYDYTQIALFYFHNVKIMDSRRNSFFQQTKDGLE